MPFLSEDKIDNASEENSKREAKMKYSSPL